ncbi:molybdopterin-dependent oxidoreductase [Aquipuribacter nitratireducens]|uniref:Molybdopterin-dependent oxidoreductase n=1 Tax=Aquipuribacter nitratireducens TaxID=650104 RepID=A0ABW0GQB9_9MICO
MSTTSAPVAPVEQHRDEPSSRWWDAAAGLVALGAGLAAAELVGLVTSRSATPVVAVSDTVVDLTPPWAKDAAIALFGTNDKVFLFAVVATVAALVGATAGVLERRRPPLGALLTAALGVTVAAAALTRPDTGTLSVLPGAVAAVVGIVVLRVLLARLVVTGAGPRRRVVLLVGTGAAALGAGLGAGLLRRVGARGGEEARAAVELPTAAEQAPPLPEQGTYDDVPGLAPFRTPNPDFYRIDTALVVPRLTTRDWRLRIGGMVEREVELTWDDVLARPLVEKWATLSCVSNRVGGDLVGNALWLGVPTRELLAEARPLPGADMVLSRSTDGFTAGTPVEAMTDDRDSLLAIGMNGEPLPLEHGFPARLVVPGLYGYVSATKWVTEMTLTTFAQDQGYWTPRGWSARGPVKISSRIDRPGGSDVRAGEVVVAGLAWAMDVGVAAVEVQVDDGPWQEAELADAGTSSTWRQWRWAWQADPGSHTLRVRAIDQAGDVQIEEPAPPAPDGAQGYDEVTVRVT